MEPQHMARDQMSNTPGSVLNAEDSLAVAVIQETIGI